MAEPTQAETDRLVAMIEYLNSTSIHLATSHLTLEGCQVGVWPEEMIDGVVQQAEALMHWVLGNWDELVPIAQEWSDQEVAEGEEGVAEFRRAFGIDP